MKRILMICEAFGGGVFTYVSQLCNDMCEDFEIYLAYALRPQTPKNFREFINDRVHLIEVENFGGFSNLTYVIKVIHSLRKLEKEIKPDIRLFGSLSG